MNPKLKALREKYNSAMAGVAEMQQRYSGTDANLTPDDEQEWDRRIAHAEKIKARIERIEKADLLTAWGEEVAASEAVPVTSDRPTERRYDRGEIVKASFRRWALDKDYTGSEAQRLDTALLNAPESKAYQIDVPAGGGFAVLPQEIVGEILTLMKNYVYVRNLATVYQVPTADSLGLPVVDTDPTAGAWTSELGTPPEETTLALGKREFRPNPLRSLVKFSKTLLRKLPNFEAVVMDRIAYVLGTIEEQAFLTGDGANKPLGLMTPSNAGIPTSRDVTTAANNAIAGDDVIGCFYNLKAQYRQRAVWILGRPVVAAVRKLKDSTGNYIWQPGGFGAGVPFVAQGTGLIGGTPDTLLGRPILESEYMPSTIAANQYVGIVGDLSKYWIADSLSMTMQVLYELYATTNQIGYLTAKETDGMPVIAEAFSRLVIHS